MVGLREPERLRELTTPTVGRIPPRENHVLQELTLKAGSASVK